MEFDFRPMSPAAAERISRWRYPEPYTVYSLPADQTNSHIEYMCDPANAYYAVSTTDDDLIGFRSFGLDGQVAGGDYHDNALDTGGGLRPDLTGQRFGLPLLMAGLAFGRQTYLPAAFRVTVAAFNQRALTVVRRAGFIPVQQFTHVATGQAFVILVREPA
jgi:[ribosomal protein S18]-alanine N-acetyltransferase